MNKRNKEGFLIKMKKKKKKGRKKRILLLKSKSNLKSNTMHILFFCGVFFFTLKYSCICENY